MSQAQEWLSSEICQIYGKTSDHKINISIHEQEIGTVKVTKAANKSIESKGFIASSGCGYDKDR